MVHVEGKVVCKEEAGPVALGEGLLHAHGVELLAQPHQQDHVEGREPVAEVLRHDGLYA